MVETPYKLISKEYGKLFNGKSGQRTVKVGDISIGGDELVFIAGPCAIQDRSQLFRTAEAVKKAGAHILRGGVFKPRSSVHSFQGIGSPDRQHAEDALKLLHEAGKEFGLPVITEIRGEEHVDLAAEYIDILQVGARNMYNQDLLSKIGKKETI